MTVYGYKDNTKKSFKIGQLWRPEQDETAKDTESRLLLISLSPSVLPKCLKEIIFILLNFLIFILFICYYYGAREQSLSI